MGSYCPVIYTCVYWHSHCTLLIALEKRECSYHFYFQGGNNLQSHSRKMKTAFAKLMQKDPVESSTVAFSPGGNNVPILTRASGQAVGGVQTMGLPTGSKPSPGGGANRTVLGAIRMGDQDGNAPGSAIFPNDIFYPPGQPDREYPERTFANVGNNVYQPENNDLALHALLKRLGDQQFKAKAMQPFEDYRVQQAQAAAIADASRNASLSDVGLGREVLRNMVAERRQQNDSEFVRMILAGGGSIESAQKELQAVKDANALHEARTVEGREFQAKNLIQKMAAARGITPMVRESLSQSAAITNPQPSQAMSQAMGMPGQGAGTSPLEAGRQSIDSNFYERNRFGSALPQEDEQQAFSSMLAQGEFPQPSSGSFSMATLQGQERQQQIESASETLAARLETIRSRSSRILQPLPPVIVAKDILDRVYAEKGKKPSNTVLFSSETIQDMRPLQLLIALNMALAMDRTAYARLTSALSTRTLGTPERPAPTIMNTLKEVVQIVNKGEPNISIPFVSTNVPITNAQLAGLLQDIRTSGSLRSEAAVANARYTESSQRQPAAPAAVPGLGAGMSAAEAIAEVPVPGAPGAAAAPRPFAIRRRPVQVQTEGSARGRPRAGSYEEGQTAAITKAQIKSELARLGVPSKFKTRPQGLQMLNIQREMSGLPTLK